MNSLPEWMAREAENENAEETGACRDYDDFFSRTRYTVVLAPLEIEGRFLYNGNTFQSIREINIKK